MSTINPAEEMQKLSAGPEVIRWVQAIRSGLPDPAALLPEIKVDGNSAQRSSSVIHSD